MLVLDLWMLRSVNRKPFLAQAAIHYGMRHSGDTYLMQAIKHRLSYPFYHGFAPHTTAGSRIYR